MNISDINNHFHTQTAISALKNAYEKCSDKAAKDSILSACNAIILLHHNLGIHNNLDKVSESDGGFDPSEYCAAV